MFNIYKIIEENLTNKELDKQLEYLIKIDASLLALDDFIKNDKDLLGAKYYAKMKKENILKDNFFNKVMQYNFESNYQRTYEHYNLVINDKFIENITNLINNHTNKEVI